MFNSGWRQHIEGRQESLEQAMNGVRSDVGALSSDVRDMRESIGAVGGAVSDLAKSLTSTDGRAAERAQAVKLEMRDESERKQKERTGFLIMAGGLISTISIVVAAFCGPYISQLNQTSRGQQDDTYRIGQVRETLAGLGANQGEMQGEDKVRDEELRQHDRDLAFMKGVMADRRMPTH